MGVWTTSILIVIIYQNHILTAPLSNPGSAKIKDLKTKFGKIADQIVNPEWTLTNPDSKKNENDPDPSQNTINENDENQPNTKSNDNKGRLNKTNKRPSKKSSNKKKSNKRKKNNIRSNGKPRWYKLVTVDYLLGKLPEYRNNENEQNVVLIWQDGDERKIELNEYVDILSVKNLYNNQLIRKKRNYNNTFPLQNKLQTKNVKQEDSKKNEKNKLNIEANTNNHNQEIERQNKKLKNKQNVKKKKTYENIEKSRGPNNFEQELSLIENSEDDENSMNSQSIDNTNENMKFLKYKKSNRHKFQYVVNNKKHPINKFQNNQTYGNKLKDPTHPQKIGKTSRKNFSEADRPRLNTVKENQNSLNNIPTISKYKPEFNIKRDANIPTDIPELNKIDTMINDINSKKDENIDSQNIEIYPLSKIRHNGKSKSKKKGQQQPNKIQNMQNRNKQQLGKPLGINNINKKKSHQKTIKPNSPNTKDILIISYDEPKITTNINSAIADSKNEPDEIDTILDEQNWNSDEQLQDQTKESYPSSFETKEDISNYSDVEDIKEHNISDNIKKDLRHKSKKLGEKQSDDSNKPPNKIKPKLNPSLKSNNDNETGSPQNPIKKLAPKLQEIPKNSNDIQKLTTEENSDNITNTKEPEEIDTILDAQNWNSDEQLQDQTKESYPSSFETKEDISNYSDVEDIKEHNISDNIKKDLRHKSKKLGEKQSDDSNKPPNKIKPKLNPSLKSNNDNETGSPQNPIKKLAPKLQEIPKNSNDIQKLTTVKNSDNITNTKEPEEIDTILDAQNWNSDEQLQDQTKESSYPSSFETKEDISNFSDVEDIKEHDITNNIQKNLRHKSKKLGEKKSDDSKKPPNKIKPNLNPSLKSNNDNETGSPQNPIKKLAPKLQEIPKNSNDIQKLTTEENSDNVTKTKEPEEIDTILDAQNWNSDEQLQDQTKESYPSSFETKEDISNYSDVEDVKEHDITNDIQKKLRHKSKKLGEKKSDDSKKPPNKIKPKLNPSLKSNNDNETGSQQNTIKKLAQNLQDIPKNSNDIQKLTTEENSDNVTKTKEPEEIDTILDAQNWNSDEQLQDQTKESYPSSFETKEDISNYSDVKDIKEHDILNNIQKNLRHKSKKLPNKNDFEDDILKNLEYPLKPKSKNLSNYLKQTPQLNEDSISNKYDTPNMYSQVLSMDNFDSDIGILDILDDYDNLDGTTGKDSDLKKPKDKSTNITDKQDINLTENNKSIPNIVDETIKSEIADNKGTLNLADEIPEDIMALINDDSDEKQDEEKPSDKSISVEPKTVKIPKSEKELSTDDTVDKNSNIDSDTTIQKETQPNTFESETGKPISGDDSGESISIEIPIQIIPKANKLISNSSPGSHKITDEVDKSISSPIDQLLTSHIDEVGLQLPSIDSDDITVKAIEKTDDSLPNSKDDEIESSISKEGNIQSILEKNKSMENTNKIIEKPLIKEESISNKYDTPNMYSQNLSMDNFDSDIGILDILDDYDNLDGTTGKDSDLKKPKDKSTNVKDKQGINLTENNKSIPNIVDETIKSEIADNKGTLNLADEIREDIMALINDDSDEKQDEEKPSDKSISVEPKTVKIPKSEKELSTDDTVDKNSNIDSDTTIQKETQPNTFESETGKPISGDDSGESISIEIPIQIIPKANKLISNSSPGSHKITDEVDKSISSPIDQLLTSHIDEVGLQLPSKDSDDITVKAIEKTDDSLPNSKDDEIESSISKEGNIQSILDKNKSMENTNKIIEKPLIKEESISNKYDTPNMYSQNLSMDNFDSDIGILDILDDYDNLDGTTGKDSDLKKPKDKSTNITDKQDINLTENNKSIPNIVDETIKSEIADNKGTLNLADEIPEDIMALINDDSDEKQDEEKTSDKSISVEPKTVKIPKSEKELSTDDTVDKNSNIDSDTTIQKETQPNTFESETGKPISGDDSGESISIEIPIQIIPKANKLISNSSPGSHKITDEVDKSISSPIDQLLTSHIDEVGLQLPSIDSDDITVKAIEKTDDSLPNSKDDEIESSISKEGNIQSILEKNKSMENTNKIIEKPLIKEESISNKYDTPNMYSQNLSMDNFDSDIGILDILDDYDNLDGTTGKDSDLKKPKDKSTNVKDKQGINLTENNKSIPNIVDETIKSEIADNKGTLNLADEIREDIMALINDDSDEKQDEEKPSDKSISVEPKTVKIPKSEKELSTDDTVDKNSNIDSDTTIQKETQPNTFESETGKPISGDDSGESISIEIPIQIIPKANKLISNSSPGSHKITDEVDKSISSPIDQLLTSHIDEVGLQLPSKDSDDITVKAIEKTDDSLPNSKDDEIESSISKEGNIQSILDKNKSMENTNKIIEKPLIKEESISNKYDTPNMYSQNLSMDNFDSDIGILDILDDYDNLDGTTGKDSDLKKPKDKSTNITDKQDINLTENNKSIPNIVDETIKSEIADNKGTLNLADEIPEDIMALINDDSDEKQDEEKTSDKSISVEPKTVKIPKSEKELSTDDTVDKNSNIDSDTTIQKETQPNTFESETGKPISGDDSGESISIEIPIQIIPKANKLISNSSPGSHKITDEVDKSISSPIDQLLTSHIDEVGLQLPSIDSDDITVKAIEKTDDSLPNSKDDEIESSISKEGNIQSILEKNKSMENTNKIIEKPLIKEESISNKYDTPNMYSQNLSMDNFDSDIGILDILDDYDNLDGTTGKDSDLKKPKDKSTNVKDKQGINLTENNKSIPNIVDETIKSEIADNKGTLNLADEIREDIMALINDDSDEKQDEEKPSDKSISVEPKTVKIPKSEKELSTDDTVDKNSNIDSDTTIQKETQPNTFESETGKPISGDDSGESISIEIPIQIIPKANKLISNSSPGSHKITDEVDKSISSPIDQLLTSHIDEVGLQLPSIDSDDITVKAIKKTDDSLPKSKDDKIEFSISKEGNNQSILEKNKSMENTNKIIEKPLIKDKSISNKYDTANMYSQNLSMDNSDSDFGILDILDDYDNLDGTTGKDSDLKKPKDKSTNVKDKQGINLTENNKSIPNIVDETIKSEIDDNKGTLNLADEIPEDIMALINDDSDEKQDEEKPSDKSISVEPKTVKIPKSEKELSTDDTVDKNSNIDSDTTIQKETQPNTFESETGKPISGDDSGESISIEIPIQIIPKANKLISNSSPGSHKITDEVDKSISSPIDQLLTSHIDEVGLQLPSIDSDDITVKAIEKTDDSLPNSKDDEIESSISKEGNIQSILEKNKSMENTNKIIEKPLIKEESISNKYDTPNMYSQNLSMDNFDSDIGILDILDDYDNLDGTTGKDSDLKKPKDKSTNITDKQDINLTENNKSIPNIVDETIKPEIADNKSTLNLADEIPEDLKAVINDDSDEKQDEEKPSDKSISVEPKTVKIPMSEKELSTDDAVDKNSNIDSDTTIQKETQPNTFESETGKPISGDDSGESISIEIPIQIIPKANKLISNSSPGSHKITDEVDKSISSPIDQLLTSHIDEVGLQLPSIDSDDITVKAIEKTDDSLPKSKDDKIEFSISKEGNNQSILEKNKSMENTNKIIEKPLIKDKSISNKYDTANMFSQNLSMDNSDSDIEILDILDDYDNLDGTTGKDSDLKKPKDKSTNVKDKQVINLTENNKSIPNIVDETIKPEIADNKGTLNLADEIREDIMALINDDSDEKQDEEKPSDKSISVEPKTVKIPKSEKELSTDDTVDKNSNIDSDTTIQKETQPNTFESETGKPISGDDSGESISIEIPIQIIPKANKLISNSSPGSHKITDEVDKSISSPIDQLLTSHIDEVGLQLPSIDSDDITVKAIEKTDDSLPKSKDDKIEFSISKEGNNQSILEKNKSMENTNKIIEKPLIKDKSISNKYDTANMYSQNLSMDNSDSDFGILDILDDYDNLDGTTGKDSDLKKPKDKSTNVKDKQGINLTENNKSIPNIVDETIKPEIADNKSTLNLADEIPEDLKAVINDLSYENHKEEKPSDKSIPLKPKIVKIPKSKNEASSDDTIDKNSNMNGDGIPLKFTPVKRIKQQNKDFLKTTPSMEQHTKTETLKEFVQTKINNDAFLLANDNPKVNLYKGLDNKYYDPNHIDKLTNIIDENSHISHYPSFASSAVTSEDNSPIISDYNLMNENNNIYGYKLPKYITKYIEDGNSNNLSVPPKKYNNSSIHKDSDNYNNDINQSIDFIKDYIISNHVNNNRKNISETETVKNIYDNKGNYIDINDIHNKMYDDFLKKISEQLFRKIDKMYDKISKLGNLSNNSTYITQNYNIRPDDPVIKKNILMNDLPISKPINNMDELDSKLNKSVATHETMINYEINDDNVIKESIKPKKDKHKKNKRHNKKHKRHNKKHKKHNKKHKKHPKHNRHKKKKSHKKNDKNYNYDDDDDNEDDDNDDVDGSHNKYKIHKKNYKKDDNDKHKKNKNRKKNKVIDYDIDDIDDNGRIKKKSDKKKYIDDDNIEISRNKKKKKKIKKNISPHESNEVNNSSSLQLNSEDDDSVKGLKIKSISKKPTKTNSTKKKKSSPKKKPKHIKHSKSMKYKNKEILVDVSDEDLSSNKNNYNFEEIYVKSSRNKNQNNAPKEKTHKHKKRKHKKSKKPLKTSKTYKYKEIPVDNEDKFSDENSVNLEETYNINIINDGNALKQKRLKHERLKKMKNIDINIIKDTDNQVLDKNTNTRHGFQFYTIYPQLRFTNPFARLFTNR